MAVQDLTPQLRTRLSRVERAVGWFVLIATLLLITGFAYYIYVTATRRGWFLTKVQYFTLVDSATGLKIGDPVKMMGFDIGEITRIDAQPPDDHYYNVYVEYEIRYPYYGYVWTEGSRARINAADFLGKRVVEVTKGTNGHPTYLFFDRLSPKDALANKEITSKVFLDEFVDPATQEVFVRPGDWITLPALEKIAGMGVDTLRIASKEVKRREKGIRVVWDEKAGKYIEGKPGAKPPLFYLLAAETRALTDRLEGVASQVEEALPNILRLTNQLTGAMSNVVSMTANANNAIARTQPIISNLTLITAMLTNSNGSLGDWLIPTNLNHELTRTAASAGDAMAKADSTLAKVDTNVLVLISNINLTLENVANITSNLNGQVQANDQMLSSITRAITNADDMVQGLKRHWLLRSAFKETPTNEPPKQVLPVPKAGKQH